MKYLLLLFLFTSCAALEGRKSARDKMRDCVFELVGQHGASPEEATKSCEKIYRPRGQ